MRLPAKCVAALLPLLLAAGCTHKTNQAQVQQPALAPPIVDAPPVKTAAPTDLPAPVVTPPRPLQAETTQTPPPPAPAPRPKHKKPAAKPADPAPAAAAAQQTASNGTQPGVSAIGQLSSGDAGDVRSQTEESILSTERGLGGINRKLSDQEQKTADQIEEFLKEARKALTTGDVDGAHTLAAKAKVLLGELTK